MTGGSASLLRALLSMPVMLACFALVAVLAYLVCNRRGGRLQRHTVNRIVREAAVEASKP